MTENWPTSLDTATVAERQELRKLVQAAEVELEKQARLTRQGHDDPSKETAESLNAELHKNLMAEASSAVQRITDNAKFIQTVAAGLATLYTGALGLTFAITTNPVPTRGFIPPFFFALAMGLAAIYLAYLTDTKGPDRPVLTDSAFENIWRRTTYFTNYARVAAHSRRGWLRASVMALVVGITFAPTPWVDFGSGPPVASASESDPDPAADPPVPPDGNERAAALLYEFQLDEYKQAQKASAATSAARLTIPFTNGRWIPIDIAIWILAIVVWLLLVVGVGIFADRGRPPSTAQPDPVLHDTETP